LVRELWQHLPAPMIVDASALDWLAGTKPERADFVRVVTPHPGEAARLLGATAAQVQANRLEALREISAKLGNCRVVLKGQQTLIGRSTGSIVVNSSGNPQLAQGGSGDVLAGHLSGLLAQPAMQADPLKTISYGVWQHGEAADRLSRARSNWVVEELAAEIGNRGAGNHD
jgi:NAD(P)H-hydrate epimerase